MKQNILAGMMEYYFIKQRIGEQMKVQVTKLNNTTDKFNRNYFVYFPRLAVRYFELRKGQKIKYEIKDKCIILTPEESWA